MPTSAVYALCSATWRPRRSWVGSKNATHRGKPVTVTEKRPRRIAVFGNGDQLATPHTCGVFGTVPTFIFTNGSRFSPLQSPLWKVRTVRTFLETFPVLISENPRGYWVSAQKKSQPFLIFSRTVRTFRNSGGSPFRERFAVFPPSQSLRTVRNFSARCRKNAKPFGPKPAGKPHKSGSQKAENPKRFGVL